MRSAFDEEISAICALSWGTMTEEDSISVAWAYYFFSIQFRENLQIARELYPDDEKLQHLEREECDTDNLSPWPGVAGVGEKLNHDEFMRRVLTLSPQSDRAVQRYREAGNAYLAAVRATPPATRAMSIASYEDGGLERVFRAMLTSPDSSNPLLAGFRHFLSEHIRFDSDPSEGHGALARHLRPDDRILPLWSGFKHLLLACAPALAQKTLAAA